jgi:hypothetical protein
VACCPKALLREAQFLFTASSDHSGTAAFAIPSNIGPVVKTKKFWTLLWKASRDSGVLGEWIFSRIIPEICFLGQARFDKRDRHQKPVQTRPFHPRRIHGSHVPQVPSVLTAAWIISVELLQLLFHLRGYQIVLVPELLRA